MFTFKKIVLLVLVVALALSIVGCGGGGSDNNDGTVPGLVEQMEKVNEAAKAPSGSSAIVDFLTCQEGSKVCNKK